MKKNQGTTAADKEDNTDSTATKIIAAFASVCELELDNRMTEGLTETTTLNYQTYVFGNG